MPLLRLGTLCLVIGTTSAAALDVGAPVPAWELNGTDGASWSSEGLRGSVVVLEFWPTWCPKCRANIAEVALLTRDFADGSVQVIAVNILDSADPVAYMKDRDLEIDFALNGDDLAQSLGVAGTPTAPSAPVRWSHRHEPASSWPLAHSTNKNFIRTNRGTSDTLSATA